MRGAGADPRAPERLPGAIWPARFPQKSEEEREQAALGCQGVLGRAVAQLEGNDTPQWQSAVETLAEAIERGGELELFQASMALDQKDSLLPMLEALEESLGRPGAWRPKTAAGW